jgi:hypothetical protein
LHLFRLFSCITVLHSRPTIINGIFSSFRLERRRTLEDAGIYLGRDGEIGYPGGQAYSSASRAVIGQQRDSTKFDGGPKLSAQFQEWPSAVTARRLPSSSFCSSKDAKIFPAPFTSLHLHLSISPSYTPSLSILLSFRLNRLEPLLYSFNFCIILFCPFSF